MDDPKNIIFYVHKGEGRGQTYYQLVPNFIPSANLNEWEEEKEEEIKLIGIQNTHNQY